MTKDNMDFLPPRLALEIIRDHIFPLTQEGVRQGNKIFGAAIVRKSDLSLVIAATNHEIENPLWHGEMQAIRQFHFIPEDKRPKPADCYFLATHEPCTLCLSAISWGGYNNFSYLFSHEDSRDAFAIPHDLKILKEVFGLNAGEYRKTNEFWKSTSILEQIKQLDNPEKASLITLSEEIGRLYHGLSQSYQSNKSHNNIPLN